MTNQPTTYGGILLDAATTATLMRLLAAVATLHHVEGDALGAQARELLRVLPELPRRDVARQSETPVEYGAHHRRIWEPTGEGEGE